MNRAAAARALIVLLLILLGTPALFASMSSHAPDLGVGWPPAVHGGVLAPPVLDQLGPWTHHTGWALWYAVQDGEILPWLIVLAGWGCWAVLGWWTLRELAAQMRYGVVAAGRRMASAGPRAWIGGLVTTVLIGLSPGTVHAATRPPDQPAAATAPRHPEPPQQPTVPAEQDGGERLTTAGVEDPPAPPRPDPRVVAPEARPECPRYTVAVGDNLWTLAREHLGDGHRYTDIISLNAERIPANEDLQPGWVLLLPPDAHGLPAAAPPLPPATRWVTVTRGDTLSSIAQRELGDADTWPALLRLNARRLQPDGRTLRDPNLLLPGWQLALPATAEATAHTATPPPNPPRSQDTPPDSPSRGRQAPDRETPPPPTARQTPVTPNGPTVSTPPPTPAPAPGAGPVILPSGDLVGAGIATAVAATVTLVRRRRRHARDIPTNPDLPEPPPRFPDTVRVLEHAGHTTAPPDSNDAPDGADMSVPAQWPPSPVVVIGHGPGGEQHLDLADVAGLGLTGAGAPPAARALIAAALVARNRHPTQLYALGTTAHDMLTGQRRSQSADSASAAAPRIASVHLADDPEAHRRALGELEAELARRARLLADTPPPPNTPVDARDGDDRREHADTDAFTALRRAHPELNLPTILVVADPGDDASEHARRLAAISTQGRTLGVYAVVLGTWSDSVDLDSHTTVTAVHGHRVGVLAETQLDHLSPAEVDELLDLIATARTESTQDTSQETTTELPEPAQVTAPLPERSQSHTAHDSPGGASTARPAFGSAPEGHAPRTDEASALARLRLLGAMRLDAGGADVTGLRSLSWELLAYLATHPEGASPGLLEEELLADHSSTSPRRLLQKAISHARTILRDATSTPEAEFITSHAGRYRLDHAHLACDVVELTRALHTARTTADDTARHQARQEIATLCRAGPPLPDALYRWAEETRQYLTSRVLTALHTLATTLADTDPERALDILEIAITWEPYAESLYRQTITLHQQLGHTESAYATFRLLRTRLADIDRTPNKTTQELVAGAGV